MISDNFWKILFVLMLLGGIFFWLKNNSKKNAFNRTASELAQLISFTDEDKPRKESDAHERFIRAVALVYRAETSSGIDRQKLYNAALEELDIKSDSTLGTLIRESINESINNGTKLGIFEDSSLWELLEGTPVKITTGPFEGEKIAVARHVPASIADGAKFFVGNLVIVPQSVADLSQELFITDDLLNTSSNLVNADIIEKTEAKAIKDNYYLQRERNKY